VTNIEHIAKLGRIVTGFSIVDHHIDCRCGKEVFKLEKNSGDLIYAKEDCILQRKKCLNGRY
jgi:hypothetical protein